MMITKARKNPGEKNLNGPFKQSLQVILQTVFQF